MANEEIKDTFLGQTVSRYDGWNGDVEVFIVTDVDVCGSVVVLQGEKENRNYIPRISFGVGIVDELVRNGRYVSKEEIDHCPFEVEIEILPTKEEAMKERIESIKSEIKCLKNKQKRAETDYKNYLVSSIRIEVIKKGNN